MKSGNFSFLSTVMASSTTESKEEVRNTRKVSVYFTLQLIRLLGSVWRAYSIAVVFTAASSAVGPFKNYVTFFRTF